MATTASEECEGNGELAILEPTPLLDLPLPLLAGVIYCSLRADLRAFWTASMTSRALRDAAAAVSSFWLLFAAACARRRRESVFAQHTHTLTYKKNRPRRS
jgi:hypothetical protein